VGLFGGLFGVRFGLLGLGWGCAGVGFWELWVYCLGWFPKWLLNSIHRTNHRWLVRRWAKSLKSIPKEIVADCIIPYCNAVVHIDMNRMTRADVIKAIYGRGTGSLWVVCFRRLKLSYDAICLPNYSETLKLYSIPFQQITYIHIDCVLRRHIIFQLKRAFMSAPNLRELQMPTHEECLRLACTTTNYDLLVKSAPQHCIVNLGSFRFYYPSNSHRPLESLVDRMRTGTQLIVFQLHAIYKSFGTIRGIVPIVYFLRCEDGILVEFRIKYPPYVMKCYNEQQIDSMSSFSYRYQYETLFQYCGRPEIVYFENWIPTSHERRFLDIFRIPYKYDTSKCVFSLWRRLKNGVNSI